MHAVLNRDAFLAAVGRAAGNIERRHSIPILANVKLTVTDGAVGLTSTDMDIYVDESVPAEDTRAAALTVPCHTLHDILRKLPASASVELDGMPGSGKMTLRSGRSRFSLPCLDAGDYPVFHEQPLPHTFDLPASQLLMMIRQTSFAVSTEETRYYLNGIYLEPVNVDGVDMLRAVTTDGHRLAMCNVPLPDGAAGMPGIIVPRKTVALAQKLIDRSDGSVQISASTSQIRFSVEGVALASKLIDGNFPDYSRVVPWGNDTVAEATIADLRGATERVSAISADRSKAVKLDISRDGIAVTSRCPDNGEASDEIDGTLRGDEDLASIGIGFNSRYLLDILERLAGDVARIRLNGSGDPVLFSSLHDTSSLFVLMPMRV